MNVRPEVVEILRQWVRKAEHDLEAARRIVAIEEGCPFDTVCFHCRQVAEKYLKCLLTYLGIQAPRTHDLPALAALIPLERCLAVRVEDLAELNPYGVNVRYADDWREPQLNDARRALVLASQVRTAVRELMPASVVE
ncbi:MAG: HEPN domain-containing protein [Bryobacteraceae bacterium]